ncbi:TonB-dependent receptor [Gilvibacter sp.]|uniref:TonB-dependent receptor n=1 Tax=Gilvibacter sp. TaxID=2729997 RepID=UPI0025B8134B|nr:TonB-dependent receptor [Gilvibacter sp.]NQX78263.1 TonB-dependent receptor [Gilvibacter sp.]
MRKFTKSLVLFLISCLGFLIQTFGQTTVNGSVTDPSGNPVEGANVFLVGTYDGASTAADGSFSFESEETGVQTLSISYIGFETLEYAAEITAMNGLTLKLREDLNALETVVLSAGTFEAGDNSKVSVLKPLDVVTTASALGDFVGALQTLPGTTTVSEDGRLFVRGGDAGETQIFIDGIRVFTPYTPTTNNIPSRGRYSPFLFDGITFSTGGYSAEFGQGLSSVLLLNTIDEPVQNKTDIAIMTVGGSLGHTKLWDKSSVSFNASYINLAPYLVVYPDRNDWDEPFETFAGEAVYRHKIGDGLLKVYTAFDSSNFSLTQEDINLEEGLFFRLKNRNWYTNSSYYKRFDNGWKLDLGGSFTVANTDVTIIDNNIDNTEYSVHAKAKVRKRFNSRFKLAFGAEQFWTDFDESFNNPDFNADYGFNNNISAAFAESDIIFSKKFAVKLGVRGEYTQANDRFSIAPRVSSAYKTGKHSQLSLAYGNFYQQVGNDFLKFSPGLDPQMTQHYILNYQFSHEGKIFRAELYRKDYNDLVTFDTEMASFESQFGNAGDGYAQGFDLFWRDNTSIKNLDYWVSYSYLDTERQYQNFPTAATPNFANTHNLSVVTKLWVDKLKSQLGWSYQYGSGRTYTDLNRPGFLQEKTKDFHSLSFNWAYLIDQQKILYFSVNNMLGFRNVNGYQYANTPNANGQFDRRALRPAADQFFFVGFFWTISDDGTDNQLDNL